MTSRPWRTRADGHGPPLHIAMFVCAIDGRAVSRVVLKVSEQLATMGAEVTVVCAIREPDVMLPTAAGLAIEVLGTTGGHMLLGAARVASWLRLRKPDVLFAHLVGPGRSAIVARALARVSTRIVVVEHTHVSTFNGGGDWLRNGLTALLYPRADRVAGVSPAVVEDLLTRVPGIRGRTALLPSAGPDPADLAVACREPPDHPWYHPREHVRLICSVGNLVPRKGQETLVEALPLVRAALGDVRLVVVGRYDNPAFLQRMEERSRKLGVREQVDFIGFRPDARPYIAHAHVFAHASWTEGCGVVLIEAMACGTPIVATDCPGGASYVLDHGRCGRLVPVRDPAAMADAICGMLRHDDVCDMMIACGRERAAQFSPHAVAMRYRVLADECLGAAPPVHNAPSRSASG